MMIVEGAPVLEKRVVPARGLFGSGRCPYYGAYRLGSFHEIEAADEWKFSSFSICDWRMVELRLASVQQSLMACQSL